MAKRIAISNLNASTIDILNTIRANASYEYQTLVPQVTTATDIPKVGEVLYGYPALANQFINALINRIAMVKIKSATFNNAYAEFKKGYLELGETVEEVFVNICKAREFSAEKAEARELKRSLPDVRTAFHAMNYRVQYPITIQDEDLRMCFTDMTGVQDFIAKLVNSVTVAAEYDEYLLFKYLMIKAIAHGKMYPVALGNTMADHAVAFRGTSNKVTFINTKYNADGVHTNTSKEDQYIFMDSDYNASYDVNVLAGAFNMDKAEFIGKLKLIDDWTTFDNERFEVIRANSDMIEAVTDEELALMSDVVAVLLDKEWFQIYDNQNKFTEKYVASGEYWNYFYNVWKTVSSSPFSNAIVFVKGTADVTPKDSYTVTVTDKSVSDTATILTLDVATGTTLEPSAIKFLESQACVQQMIAVHRYGAVIIPKDATAKPISFELNGVVYTSGTDVAATADVGDTFTFTRNDYIANTLSALTVGALTLTPTFDSSKTSYTATTTSATNTITATATDSNATVTIKNGDTTVTSGGSATWSVGENTVTVTVKGNSEGQVTTKVYTVVVTKTE